MEPYAKRQRLYAPLRGNFSRRLQDQHGYYDDAMEEFDGDDHGADFIEEGEEDDQVDEGDENGAYLPEEQFRQKRAQLDHKLKSTFEAIFEKYGQDFEGVGDEIDLETGEILVNNGHLLEMRDERDAGDTTRFAGDSVGDDIEEPTDTDDIDVPSSSPEETEDLEDDDDEEETFSEDEETIEDDMILRGFAQANRFTQASPESGPSRVFNGPKKQPRQPAVSRPSIQRNALPSRNDILAQFGPQLGPQIVNFVSKQQVQDESQIEPAWRAPELSMAASMMPLITRPLNTRRAILEPDIERSPSPEARRSIWAPVRKRGPGRADGLDAASIFREERIVSGHELNVSDPYRHRSMNDFGLPPESLPKRKRVRIDFTAEEDRMLEDWIARGRAQGLAVWSNPMWKELEKQHPRHTWKQWKGHYQRCFTYIAPSENADMSDSETSVETHMLEERGIALTRMEAASHAMHHPASERPTRIRKPAQRDPKIVSWSQAVDTIESLDPDLHAGIIEDTRMMNGHSRAFDYSGRSNNHSQRVSATRPLATQTINTFTSPRTSGRSFNDLDDIECDELGSVAVDASPSPEASKCRAPCPHADCRLYDNIMYRLQRLENEDLSEMCLHLFRVHHTTPFPCGEVGCGRKGEEGYFMQADLVKHVGISHPNSGALHRLRGRVDQELLDRPLKSIASIPLNGRLVGQAKDSDFMSPQKRYNPRLTPSSRPFSSCSDPERTPGITAMLGASTSTPLTSVSSLKVHHSSAKIAPIREISESHSPRSEERRDDGVFLPRLASQVPRERLNDVNNGKQTIPTIRQPLVQGPLLSRNDTLHDDLPTPKWESPRMELNDNLNFEETEAVSNKEIDASAEKQLSEVQIPSSSRKATGSKLPTPQKPVQVPLSSSTKPNQLTTTRSPASKSVVRNTVDPSYEFSDDESGVAPVTKQPSSKLKAKVQPATNTPATNNTVKKQPASVPAAKKLSFVTPAAKPSRKVKPATVQPAAESFANKRKALLQTVLDSDYDELSLNANDFVFLFSQQLTTAGPSSEVQVKEEDETTDTPRTLPSVPTKNKKRKFGMFRDDEDELCVITPSTEIKAEEVDDDALPLPESTQQMAKKRKISDTQLQSAASKHKPSQARRLAKKLPIRSGTPLLDLTPSRSKVTDDIYEIQDSAADVSSSLAHSSPNHPRNRTRGQREAAGTSSPLVGLLTPVRKKGWSAGNPLEGKQVDVVVKTPGGTFRRCGEDDFQCKKAFCFRCNE